MFLKIKKCINNIENAPTSIKSAIMLLNVKKCTKNVLYIYVMEFLKHIGSSRTASCKTFQKRSKCIIIRALVIAINSIDNIKQITKRQSLTVYFNEVVERHSV